MAQDTQNTSELTQEEVARILTAPLEQESVFLSVAQNIYDTAGPLRIPSLPDSKATALAFVGENEKIPEQDYDFGEVQLMPSTMKSVKVLTKFSNELARQSVVALDAALQARLVADVAAKVDAQFLSASGDGTTTPKGLFAWTGTQKVTVKGALTVDGLLQAQGLALAAHVNPDALTLFIRPEDYMAIRGQKDGDGRYLLQPDAQAGGLVIPVLGASVKVTDHVPSGRAALVDMSKVAVARDAAPAVKLLDQTFGDYDQQAIRVVTRMDAAPLKPSAVVTFSGLGSAAA